MLIKKEQKNTFIYKRQKKQEKIKRKRIVGWKGITAGC